jgi:hypothetical protein
MRLSQLARIARQALRTEQGRRAVGRATDTAADAARRYAPRHQQRIDSAHRTARRHLDRQ